MGAKNPSHTLEFARKFLHHHDPKIRREIVHGIELRGRTHPEEILPLLEELQNDPDKKVRATVIHVLGQINRMTKRRSIWNTRLKNSEIPSYLCTPTNLKVRW